MSSLNGMDQSSTSLFTFSQLLYILIQNHPREDPLLEGVIKLTQLIFANDFIVNHLVLKQFHFPFDYPSLKSSNYFSP